MKKQFITGILVVSLLGFAGTATTSAFNLGSIVKIGGVGYLVSQFGDQLNSFLNGILMKNGVGTDYATKVVPIVSIGQGGYIGAAQVVGPTEQVAKVESVGQLESGFNGKMFRVKALIPLDSKNPTNMTRVQGVGVSAIIDVNF